MVSRDRGQIMLVGAIAVAFVVLGLATVYTAQLTARPATTGSVSDQAAEATELNREARRNVRAIAVRENHDEPYYLDRAAVDDSIRRGTTNYSRLMAETYGGERGAVVNVSYDGTSRWGTRTVQYDDDVLRDGVGNPTWRPVDGEAAIGWFVFNFNLTAMEKGDEFVVRVENGTGVDPPETTYTFSRNATGRTILTVEVDSETGAASLGRGTCNPIGNRSLIDLTSGDSFTSNCEFGPGIDRLEGPYTVQFEQGTNAVGRFSVVTDAGTPSNGLPKCPATEDPCNTPAAWTVTLTTRYESGELSYENTQNVTVYEGI
jgi:hypothetical protein